MILQVQTIARNTFVESVRQPIYLILSLLCGVLIVLSTWATAFSMGHSDQSSEVTGDNKLLFDVGLATVFVCGMILTAFLATATISREIENKTILTVVSKPVGRTTLVLGKFAGIAAAITCAVLTMLLFLLLAIRHEVMSTAADELDGPVILFSLAALLLSVGLAAWCNFYYGWSFPQVASLLLLPLSAAGYVLVLAFDKEWNLQPLSSDFKPQIMLACLGLLMAMYVLTAVATAASTRLGQVMTIMVCAGVFVFGLLSNHLLGRQAFLNTPIAVVAAAEPVQPSHEPFNEPGQSYTVTFDAVPNANLVVGRSIFYGSTPNGWDMVTPAFEAFEGDASNPSDLYGSSRGPGLIVTGVGDDRRTYTLTLIGPDALKLRRPPRAEDHIFLEPRRVNVAALGVWSIVPNMHYFWMLDAITRNVPIPPRHIGLLAMYSGLQVGAFLCLAVVLLERRDLG